jgi:hypothetical protein
MSSDIEAQAEERDSLFAIYETDCEYDSDACSYKVGGHVCCSAVLLLLLLLLLCACNSYHTSVPLP